MECKPFTTVLNIGLKLCLTCRVGHFVTRIGDEEIRFTHAVDIAVVIGNFHTNHVVLRQELQ